MMSKRKRKVRRMNPGFMFFISLIVFCLILVIVRASGVDNVSAEPQVTESPKIVTYGDVEALEIDDGSILIDASEIESKSVEYFDVPLEEDLQDHIFRLCEKHNVDPAIVIAMIEVESQYTADAIGDNGNSYGLMQIQPVWHEERMAQYGFYEPEDLLDPYQNVMVGVNFLGELMGYDNSIEWVLMAYNDGPIDAYANIEAGYTSRYASTVLELAKELRE